MMFDALGYIIGVIVLFLFIIFVSGCSTFGIDLAKTRTYAITKPPFQIVVSGDLSTADKTAVRQIINDLSKTDYQDYKFNENIQVTVIGSETDIENVNLKTTVGGSNEIE